MRRKAVISVRLAKSLANRYAGVTSSGGPIPPCRHVASTIGTMICLARGRTMEIRDDDLAHFEAHGAAALPAEGDEGYVEHDGARIWYATYRIRPAGDPAARRPRP